MTQQLNTKIKPLDILGIRRVNFCPPTFNTVNLERTYNIQHVVSEWIEDNLSGRYFIGENVALIEDNENSSIKNIYTVGFEKESEMSYFMIACPHLKYAL